VRIRYQFFLQIILV